MMAHYKCVVVSASVESLHTVWISSFWTVGDVSSENGGHTAGKKSNKHGEKPSGKKLAPKRE